MHWGRVVRTQGFLKLPRQALVELSQEIDMEGRVVGGKQSSLSPSSSSHEELDLSYIYIR
jgi:hypothetical protein